MLTFAIPFYCSTSQIAELSIGALGHFQLHFFNMICLLSCISLFIVLAKPSDHVLNLSLQRHVVFITLPLHCTVDTGRHSFASPSNIEFLRLQIYLLQPRLVTIGSRSIILTNSGHQPILSNPYRLHAGLKAIFDH